MAESNFVSQAISNSAKLKNNSTSSRIQSISHFDILIPLTLLIVIALTCFIGPIILPLPEPSGGNVLESNLPLFSTGHWLGTDVNGNDVMSRLLHGGRISLLIAISANVLGLLLGTWLGASSAYFGGVVDSVIMRILDTFIAFPSLVMVLAIAQALEPSPSSTIIALTFFSVPAFARVARVATLPLRELPFIAAAQISGTAKWRILMLHIGPNIFPQLVAFALLGMGVAIIIEGALSFLGLGVQPPAPSWGAMIHQGQQTLSVKPSLVLLPSLCLFVTVLMLNLLGEGLRSRWGRI